MRRAFFCMLLLAFCAIGPAMAQPIAAPVRQAVLREVARVLAAGGLFAFTVESHAGEGVVLSEGLRYAYSESCVRALVAAAGLVLDQLESASSRTASGVQVPGLVVVAAKA